MVKKHCLYFKWKQYAALGKGDERKMTDSGGTVEAEEYKV